MRQDASVREKSTGDLNSLLRVLNQVKHKRSRGRRNTEIEREVGRIKSELIRRHLKKMKKKEEVRWEKEQV